MFNNRSENQMFVKTDGGKSAFGFTDKNDCAVRAHALFTGNSYAESHEIFKKLGRKDNRGTKNTLIYNLLGEKPRKNGVGLTLSSLRRLHPTGRVYALKRGHAFTLINGVLHDSWKVGDKSRIMYYWVDNTPCTAPTEYVNAAYVPHQYSKETPTQKQTAARATFDRVNAYGTHSNYQIAKRIAAELNITVANACYYVSKFTGKR